ncbi:MAG: sulfurtransferase [Bryobacterales bacterium]|nr:sulfurtransferase [Bryobacterales bacterium]
MKHGAGFLAIVDDAKGRIREVDVAGYRAWVEEGSECVLIDTREESEWAAGHAVGAVHLSKGILERDIEKTVPETGRRIVLYCGGGFRSALAADNLQKMGYTEVYSLAGGWRAWNEAEMPVER